MIKRNQFEWFIRIMLSRIVYFIRSLSLGLSHRPSSNRVSFSSLFAREIRSSRGRFTELSMKPPSFAELFRLATTIKMNWLNQQMLESKQTLVYLGSVAVFAKERGCDQSNLEAD